MQRTKPRFASKAEMGAIARELTRRVLADKRIKAALSASVAKSARRPVLRARPVVTRAGVAKSLNHLEAVLDRVNERIGERLATQKASRDAYTRKVDAIVDGLAKTHDEVRKGIADFRSQSSGLGGIRADLSKLAERMTAAAARAPRRIQ